MPAGECPTQRAQAGAQAGTQAALLTRLKVALLAPVCGTRFENHVSSKSWGALIFTSRALCYFPCRWPSRLATCAHSEHGGRKHTHAASPDPRREAMPETSPHLPRELILRVTYCELRLQTHHEHFPETWPGHRELERHHLVAFPGPFCETPR